jgi:hypothetical protein
MSARYDCYVIRRKAGDIGSNVTALGALDLFCFRLADLAEILGQLRLQIQ